MKFNFLNSLVIFVFLICFQANAQEDTKQPVQEEGTITDINDYIITKQAQYPDGLNALYKEIAKRFKTPKRTKKNKGTHKILLTFVIEKDGELTNVKVTNDPGHELGNEAVKTLESIGKKWIPAETRDGTIVRSALTLPITINI